MPDLPTAVISGLFGAAFTAVASYMFQNRLAANRRKEQERRIAYVRLVQISEPIAAEEVAGKHFKVMFDIFRERGHDLKENIPKGAGYSERHAIAAMLARGIEEVAKKGQKPEFFLFSSPLVARAFSRMLDFSMTPSELADLPREAVDAYLSFAGLAFNLRTSIEFILQCFGEWKLANLSADFLLDTYETMLLTLEKAKELRSALILGGGLTAEETAKVHAQQCERIHKLLLLVESNRASNEAARKALESAAKQPDKGSSS